MGVSCRARVVVSATWQREDGDGEGSRRVSGHVVLQLSPVYLSGSRCRRSVDPP